MGSTDIRGITGGTFYGPTVGSLEGTFDARSFQTVINISVPADLPDRDAVLRAAEEYVKRWAPRVEALKRLEPAAGRDLMLAAYATFKHPLAAPPDAADDTVLFQLLVDHLAYRLPQNGEHPLLVFADALAHSPQLPATDRAKLKKWLASARKVGASRPLTLAAQSKSAAATMQAVIQTDPALLIALEPDEESEDRDRMRIRAWVWLGPGRTERIGRALSGSYRIDDLRVHLRDIYREALRYSAKEADRMTVEFFLPRTRLSTPVHEWPVLTGIEQDEEVWVCSLHRVVVRPQERNFSPSDAAEAVRSTWRNKWALLCAAQNGWRIYKPDQPTIYQKDRALYQFLLDAAVVGYAETLPLPADVDATRVLKRVVDAGLPIGIWLQGAAFRLPAVYHDLDTLAVVDKFILLRDHVRALRAAAIQALELEQPPPPLGAGLVLLWDDPERLPQQQELFVSPAQA